MPVDVVVLGSLNMDLVVKAERVPESGETLAGQEFRTAPGGKGANQCAAIARLGGKVAMIGRVGADDFGKQSVKNLADFGADTSHVLTDPAALTGVALVTIDQTGGNRILVVAGANGTVTKEDVDAAQPLIHQAKMLVMQLEIPLEPVSYALDMAAGWNVPVALNAAPAYPLPEDILRKVSYLIVNESEASALSGVRIDNPSSAIQAATALHLRGVSVVILTLGAQGALLAGRGTSELFPALKVDVADTTAAGDAFTGGFVTRLLETGDLSASMRFANTVGALTTTQLGAQASLPTRAKVNGFVS